MGGDRLIGGYDDDILVGGECRDTLTGSSQRGGQHRYDGIDILWGDDLLGNGRQGADIFELGKTGERYYDDGIDVSSGWGQFAWIKDFDPRVDKIQLARLSRATPELRNELYIVRHISAGMLPPYRNNNRSGTAIYYHPGTSGPDQPELLAFVENNVNTPRSFDLNAEYVVYS